MQLRGWHKHSVRLYGLVIIYLFSSRKFVASAYGIMYWNLDTALNSAVGAQYHFPRMNQRSRCWPEIINLTALEIAEQRYESNEVKVRKGLRNLALEVFYERISCWKWYFTNIHVIKKIRSLLISEGFIMVYVYLKPELLDIIQACDL